MVIKTIKISMAAEPPRSNNTKCYNIITSEVRYFSFLFIRDLLRILKIHFISINVALKTVKIDDKLISW